MGKVFEKRIPEQENRGLPMHLAVSIAEGILKKISQKDNIADAYVSIVSLPSKEYCVKEKIVFK